MAETGDKYALTGAQGGFKYLELFCTLEASETVWLAESWDTKHLQGKINQSGRDLVTLEKK